jgi:hypothetical protein
MTKDTLKEFIEGVILETRKEDLAKIRMANNSYTAVISFVRSLGKNPKSFERLFKKENGYFVGIAAGAQLKREEHTRLYIYFQDRKLFNVEGSSHAEATKPTKDTFAIYIYFDAPPEAIANPTTYNTWFVNNLEQIMNSSKIRSSYVHEFIHILDFKRVGQDFLYNQRQDNDNSAEAYINDPLELNAYFSEAMSFVRNKLKKAVSKEERRAIIGSTPQEFADLFMQKYLSKQARKFLTPENQQRFMKRAATSWELLRKVK